VTSMPNRRFLALTLFLSAVACSEKNPDACVNNTSVCKAGTQCVTGKDAKGTVLWSRCLPVDGGDDQGDALVRVDAGGNPSKADVGSGADVPSSPPDGGNGDGPTTADSGIPDVPGLIPDSAQPDVNPSKPDVSVDTAPSPPPECTGSSKRCSGGSNLTPQMCDVTGHWMDQGGACSAPDGNSVPTCQSGTCGFMCKSNLVKCSGACVDPKSPAHCGSSCTTCPVPAHALATCDGSSCGVQCDFQYMMCTGGTCERQVRSFESGTAEGLVVDSRSTVSSSLSVGMSPMGGGRALAATLNYSASAQYALYLKVPLCPSGDFVNLHNMNFSVSYFVSGPADPDLSVSVQAWAVTSLRLSSFGFFGDATLGSWINSQQQIGNTAEWSAYDKVSDLLLVIQIHGSSDWSGTLWVDNVRLDK
jgi:hypothetical protein